MKVIEANVYNEDGAVTATMSLTPEEIKLLMEFAINFLLSIGVVAVADDKLDTSKLQPKFND